MAKRGVRARVGWAKQYLGGVFGKTKLNGPGLNGPAVGHPNGINVTTSLDDNNTMADANTTKKKRPFLRRRRDTDSIEGHNNTAHISGPTVAIPTSFSRSNGAKNDHAKPKRNFFHRRAQSPAGGVNISSNNLRTDLTISAPILLKQGSTFDKSGSTIFTDSHPLIDDSDKRKLFEKVKKTGEDENCKQSNAAIPLSPSIDGKVMLGKSLNPSHPPSVSSPILIPKSLFARGGSPPSSLNQLSSPLPSQVMSSTVTSADNIK